MRVAETAGRDVGEGFINDAVIIPVDFDREGIQRAHIGNAAAQRRRAVLQDRHRAQTAQGRVDVVYGNFERAAAICRGCEIPQGRVVGARTAGRGIRPGGIETSAVMGAIADVGNFTGSKRLQRPLPAIAAGRIIAWRHANGRRT